MRIPDSLVTVTVHSQVMPATLFGDVTKPFSFNHAPFAVKQYVGLVLHPGFVQNMTNVALRS